MPSHFPRSPIHHVGAWSARRAALGGDRPALADAERSLDYAGLEARVARCAGLFAAAIIALTDALDAHAGAIRLEPLGLSMMSTRARPPCTAFASAKAALRMVAQGMAREFGNRGEQFLANGCHALGC